MSKTQNWDFLFSFAYSLSNQNSGTTYGLFNIILFVLLGRGWSMLLVNMKNGEAVETSLPIAFPNMLFVNKTSSQWSQTIAPGWGFFFGCAFWGAVDDMFKTQDSDFFSFLVFSEQPNRGAPIVDDLCFPMFFSSCFLYQNCSFHCTSHYVFGAVCFQENEISHQLS